MRVQISQIMLPSILFYFYKVTSCVNASHLENRSCHFPLRSISTDISSKAKFGVPLITNILVLKKPQNECGSKTQIRVISKDKLPISGQYKEYKNVFLLGGLGSRGFCYGPILGDHIASLIGNNISPLEKIVTDSLQPNRFK